MTGRSQRKTFVGKVVSNKMDKSVTVEVVRRFRHPLYGKLVTKTAKFMAHDEENQCTIGDTVQIAETRPLSKKKRWRLVKIIKKAQ
ncbi:30S ribosomal protein S17 [bacterium]|nr:30S ribosomal protein S17 [bacterium]